jgi:hypothetical protein
MMFLLVVTLTSMLLAAIMSVIAWRIAADERRRSDARVAALSAEIHEAPPARIALVAQASVARSASPRTVAAPVPWDPPLNRVEQIPAYGSVDLFAQPSRSSSQSAVLFTIGVIVIGGAVASAMLLGGRAGRAARTANPVAAAIAPGAAPLELVGLGHQREGDRLIVRGIVRNPPSGAERDRLTAVVFLFTADGGFLTSGRAALESPALRPGGESTFIVTVPGATDVGRYRVSFRTDDRIVPHVDRRHES